MAKPARRAAWVLGVAGAALLLAWAFIPKPDLYGDASFSSLVTDRHGRPLRLRPAADGRYRLFTPLDGVAGVLRDATLLYEDRRFFSHPGVSLPALARAAWTTYVRRSRPVGGSTITMQLARMRFGLYTRSPLGKLAQVARALQIERHYTKDEILEAYLNLAPYGGAVEGAGAASRVYFDKPASALNPGEALALAVIPQNPVARFPAATGGREALLQARERLRRRWREQGGRAPGVVLAPRFRSPARLPFRAPHFVRDHVPHTGAAEIRTTLDLDLQTLVEARVREHVRRRHREGIRNAAAMLLDHRNGELLALVGSAGFFDEAIDGQVNGTRARRSPGSTLKPLLYGLALDAGLIHPMTLLADAPRRYSGFAPENFDRGFLGPVFARDALIHSRNVPAVDMLARLGVRRFRDWLEAAGVSRLRPAEEYGLALALGGGEVTMEELARLYAMLASGGVARRIVGIPHGPQPPSAYSGPGRSPVQPDRRFRRRPITGFRSSRPEDAAASRRRLSAEASFLVLDALYDVPRPNAPALRTDAARPIAWKTGTSFGFRDAWSVGVIGRFVLAVWVGNFNATANPAFVGRTAAAPLFFSIADSLPGVRGGRLRPRPGPNLDVRRVAVCAPTGDLPGPHCPRKGWSWFIPGVSPIKVSTVHRAVPVDAATGLRACRSGAQGTREEVFEFWPPDVEAVLRRAGIAVRHPPRWSPGCGMDTLAATGRPPRIHSPQSTVTYHAPGADAAATGQGDVLFAATAEADANRLFWFVNDRLVADVARGERYFWTPRPGRFTVRAVDDTGRAAAVEIDVRAGADGAGLAAASSPSSAPGPTASHPASSQPWNTTASPT